MHWEAFGAEINAADQCFQVQMRTGCRKAAEELTELRMVSKLNHNQKIHISMLYKVCFQYTVVYLQRMAIQTLFIRTTLIHAAFVVHIFASFVVLDTVLF